MRAVAFGLLSGILELSLLLSPLQSFASPRLNHLQMKGTHNSYHRAPALLSWTSLGYTHAPLGEQLKHQGVRQLELDVHQCNGNDFCVYHIGIIDSGTNCETLKTCLKEVKDWSHSEPTHHPIFIFIEIKDSNRQTRDFVYFDNLESQILSVFERSSLLLPDDVRGDHFTLKQAVLTKGWPSIADTRGKIVFVLLDEGEHRDNYTLDAPALQKRIMFTTSAPAREDAAIMKVDDPIERGHLIEQLVRAGFIVRTRADAELKEAKVGDFSRLEVALASGAHMISTDFPVKTPDYSYWLEIKGGMPSRCNPVTALPSCSEQEL